MKIYKISKFVIIFFIITAWIFSGFPQIFSLAQEATQADSTQENPATSTTSTTESTTTASTTGLTITASTTESTATSTQETATSSPPVTTTSTSITEEPQLEEEIIAEEEITPPEPLPQFVEPPPPPLKERKLDKNVKISAGASHRCDAETFTINISGQSSGRARLLLQKGKKVQSGEIEIGSLPVGVDIVFSKNKNYLRPVSSDDQVLHLEITNQPGSQKGNFSIPIIFTDNESNQMAVCQINILNF